MTLAPGTIVTAQGPTGYSAEQIVGITIKSPCPLPANTTLVVWLSDQRGAFSCWEADADVNVADLDPRGPADTPIDHDALALLLGDQIAMLSEGT